MLAPGVVALLLLVVLPAGIFDIRTRRIPNWLTVSGLLLGLALNTFLFGTSGLGHAALGFALAFVAYLLLHLLHAMGAGDVKLMAAVGGIVGPGAWFRIFALSAVLGGLFALALLIWRRSLRRTLWNVLFILNEMRHLRAPYLTREDLDVQHPQALTLPHGAVVALGSLAFLAISAVAR
ncbi:MAG TPA: A24 family peptidase [Bryobacteraceae bacterium]|nr:A24 family peptidase [Bryobacteraceae bacterium]